MSAYRRLRLAIGFALVPVFFLGGCASNRVADGPPLQLHREKFTYNSPAKQPVYDWFALDPSFESVLEQHPAALEEAKNATPFRTAAWATTLGMAAFSAKAMLNSISSADDPTQNDVESVKGDLIVAAGFAIGAGVFNSIARRYLTRSISLFNAEEMRSSQEESPSERASAGLLSRIELSPTYRMGEGGGWFAQVRIPVR